MLLLQPDSCSPRERGCADCARWCPLGGDMFPARAGMSRFAFSTCAAASYVPRASGDEPVPGGSEELKISCSPRERG